MYVKIVPLGLIATLLLSTVSARSIYSEKSLVARHEGDCDGTHGHHSGDHDGGM